MTQPVSMPLYLEDAISPDAPVSHKWSPAVAADLAEKENTRLQKAMHKINYKGIMGIGCAIAELVVWRFSKLIDISDANLRIEAAWAAVIDPAYARAVPDIDAQDKGSIEGPLSLTIDVLGGLCQQYSTFDGDIDQEFVVLAMIARHVAPDKTKFENWLSSSIKRLSTLCPMDLSHYNRETRTYDGSYEKPVSREAFDLMRDYSEEERIASTRRFLATLDPQVNPYLATAEEMRLKGFTGVPY